MKNFLKAFSLAVTLLIASGVSFAQGTTSSLGGQIVDQNGEIIVGAAVVATHLPSGSTYGAVTNNDGRYSLTGLRPGGPYVVEVSCLGYQPVKFTDINLALGETHLLDGYLSDDVESLTEAVVVATPSSRFAATKTGASVNVNNEEMMSLPNSTRSMSALTKLSPYASGMSFAGSDGRSTNVTIDGANFNNNFGLKDKLPGGGTPISLDAIEEVQLVVAPYDVRQTNFVGGGINAVTKSGTNTFKGTAYTYYSDEGTRGNMIMGERVGDRQFEQNKVYGFTLGGPIVKNKLFFFVNFEMQKKPEQTVQFKTEDAAKIEKLDAIAAKLRNEYNYEPGSYTDYPGGDDAMKLLARIDWNISRDHKLSLRYNNTKFNHWQAPNGNSCDDAFRNKGYNRASEASQPFSNNMYSEMNNVWSAAAELNSRFSNVVSNRFIATYTNINDQRGSNSAEFPHIDIMTDGDLSSGNYVPYTSLGYELFTYNNGVINNVLNIQDNLTFYLGTHTITAGGSFENQNARNSYMRNGTGYYRFASADDFLNGNLPVSFAFCYGNNGVDRPAGIVDYNQYGAYVQDEWNVTPRFKLSYGVRADMMDFNEDALMTNNAILAVDYGGKHVDTGKWPVTRVQVSPRVGFNWDVKGDKSLIVRGGSGLFQGRLPLVFFTNMPQNAGMIQTLKKDLTGSIDENTNTLVMSDEVKAALTALNGGKTTGGHLATTAEEYLRILGLNTTVTEADGKLGAKDDVNGVDPEFHMPQIWKTSLAIDYTVPVSFPLVMTAEGMFNKTIWGTRLVNWNIDESKLTDHFAGPDKRIKYPDNFTYGGNNAYVLTNTNKGYGYIFNYTVKATPARDLNITASYTHTESKEISGMPGSNASSAYTGLASIDGPNYLTLQRSRYVVPDKLSFNASYYLASQGLHFDLYYSGYSAFGNSFTLSNDMNGDGIAYDMMYIPATKDELTFKTPEDRDAFWAFLEQDKYLSSHKGQYAEANAANSPWIHRFDLMIAKDFTFNVGSTKHNFQVSASIDNIGNMINSKWGVRKLDCYSKGESTGFISPLKYEGVDANNVPVYSMNKVDGEYPTQTYNKYIKLPTECWQLLLGLKYFFN
ncbi:MAG: TonB-dependent receptor [Bacteroidales bacterium]|nr:TonB-dependent receptor [Bacteroidales bacterium]